MTPEAFHVIDYKTNDLSDQSADRLVTEYWPQLEAYAVALHQSDPTRTVELRLYFTDAGEPRQQSFSPEQLESLEARMQSYLAEEK